MRGYLTFITLLLYASVSQAGNEGYVCKVAAVANLTDRGTLSSNPKDELIGEEFTVDRQSGKIIGRWIKSEDYKTEVISRGYGGWSFKAIGRQNPESESLAMYLEIAEHRQAKPFILWHEPRMFSGRCL
jgi:hypothetical protein